MFKETKHTKDEKQKEENDKKQEYKGNKKEEEKNPFAPEKRRKSPIELNKKMSDEEKRKILIKKQQEYNADMAKKKAFDKEYIKEESKKYSEANKLKGKISKEERFFLIWGILLIVILFISVTYLSNPEKFNIKRIMEEKEIEKKKKEYLPEKERIAKIQERLRERKKNFDELIVDQEKPMPFPEKFSVDNFIKQLYIDNLLIEGIDEVRDNNIFIGSTYFRVDDLSIIFKDKYLMSKHKAEIRELRDLDDKKPNIIFVKKHGIYTKEGELIVNILDGKPQNFDGLVDRYSNPLVIAYDKTDGDLTDKMTFTPKLENLEDGKVYTLKYKVSNSKGEESEREYKIKCFNLQRDLKDLQQNKPK